jgi:trimeric autotransporter adhesin
MKIVIRLFFALLCLSSAGPKAQAVDPPPGGGYPDGNTAVGTEALLDLTTGMENTALGFRALTDNTQGNLNTAVGSAALKQNRIGNRNTATGFHALAANRFGNNNTANGYFAFVGGSGNSNTAVGAFALQRSTGDNNIALGFAAGANLTTGNQNIDIGNRGVAGESGTIRIGDSDQTRTFIAGISGQAVSGSPVYVNAGGQLGVLPSSERFKEDIKPMDNASEVILNVEPVTFRYKKEIDPDAVAQFGLVAEKLARVNPDLVERDREGKPFTVRYDAVNTMLLNEFLKEHRKNEKQETTIAELKTQIATLAAIVKEQDAKIERVNDKAELNKPAPQTVLNNR